MNGGIGTEAEQFPEKEYINGIFVAVRYYAGCGRRERCCATCATMEYPAPSGRNTGKTVPTSQYACRAWRRLRKLAIFVNKPAALQQKSHLCIPRKGIARPQSQFSHSYGMSVSDLYIPRIGVHIFFCSRIGRPNILLYHGNIFIIVLSWRLSSKAYFQDEGCFVKVF